MNCLSLDTYGSKKIKRKNINTDSAPSILLLHYFSPRCCIQDTGRQHVAYPHLSATQLSEPEPDTRLTSIFYIHNPHGQTWPLDLTSELSRAMIGQWEHCCLRVFNVLDTACWCWLIIMEAIKKKRNPCHNNIYAYCAMHCIVLLFSRQGSCFYPNTHN